MSPDATPVSSPEGLRFDEPAAGAGAPNCARCQAAIADAYYEVNGHVVCAGCKAALEQSATASGASRFLRATAFGLGGAIAGAGVYYAILAVTGYEIGLVAIAVGWLVGRGVHKGSGGRGGWGYQALAIALTYLAIVSTYIPFIVEAMSADEVKANALTLLGLAVAAPFLAGFENVIGLLIIGFALYQAWQMNRQAPMTINGPYAVGRGAVASGSE
jgi:hypothetical protein